MGDYSFQPAYFMVGLIVLGIALIPTILFILTLQRTLEKCAPESRTISPGSMWLLLVPLVNIVWQFMVVTGIAKSLANEFARRNMPLPEPNPGQPIGLAMCICGICGIIPLLGLLTGLAALVLWIVYWVKIAEYSRSLDVLPQAAAGFGPINQ